MQYIIMACVFFILGLFYYFQDNGVFARHYIQLGFILMVLAEVRRVFNRLEKK